MNAEVKQKVTTYPDDIAIFLLHIRMLILIVAEQDEITPIIETLKWGEPSYLVSMGSTIRLDWKRKYPNQYCIYFNCKTSFVETFKEIYGDLFNFYGNRAIVFNLGENIPVAQLKHCLSMSLRYHKIKHLPLLGA